VTKDQPGRVSMKIINKNFLQQRKHKKKKYIKPKQKKIKKNKKKKKNRY
jgi:hypothetical protein